MKQQLVKYIRDEKTKTPKGMVISFVDSGKLFVGWSLCSKADTWDKDMARKIAVNRAYFYGDNPNKPYRVAQSASKEFIKMVERSKRFFKDSELPSNIKCLS